MSIASNQALKEITKSGKRLSLKNQIYSFILELNGISTESILSLLKKDYPNTILSTCTARLSELEKAGKITQGEGDQYSRWYYVAIEGREKKIKQMKRLDFQRWAKKAKDFEEFLPEYLVNDINQFNK